MSYRILPDETEAGSAGTQPRRGIRLESKFHRWFLDAFDKRLQADYGVSALLSEEAVRLGIARAAEFVSQVEQRLGSAPG